MGLKINKHSHLQCNIVQHWTVCRGLFVNCVAFSVSFRRVRGDTHVDGLAVVFTSRKDVFRKWNWHYISTLCN